MMGPGMSYDVVMNRALSSMCIGRMSSQLLVIVQSLNAVSMLDAG